MLDFNEIPSPQKLSPWDKARRLVHVDLVPHTEAIARRALGQARHAGLAIAADGDKIVIRGPSRATALALELIDRKREVLPLFTSGSGAEIGPLDAAERWRALYHTERTWRRGLGEYAGGPPWCTEFEANGCDRK